MDIERINPREWNCSAVVHGDTVYLSRIVADDKSLPMKGQTEQELSKIDARLAEAGAVQNRCCARQIRYQRVADPKRNGLHGRRETEGRNERGLDGVGRSSELTGARRSGRRPHAGNFG